MLHGAGHRSPTPQVALTAGTQTGARNGDKKILIYDSNMHPLLALDPINCSVGPTPIDRRTWVVNTVKLMENFEPITTPD